MTTTDTPVIDGDRYQSRRSPEAGRRSGLWSVFDGLINFLIVAWILFMLVKAANTFRSREPPRTTAPTTTEALLMEIRDALVARK